MDLLYGLTMLVFMIVQTCVSLFVLWLGCGAVYILYTVVKDKLFPWS